MKSNEEKNVDIIEDDEVITLYDDENKPVDFYEVAVVEFEEQLYALLQPVEALEGVEEDEAIIFHIVEQNDKEDLFEPVLDERVLEEVFDEYIKAVADSECGCGCEECEHDHDHCDHDNHECKHADEEEHGDVCGCDKCKHVDEKPKEASEKPAKKSTAKKK